ncbi:MAG: glycosyl hydrolase [Rubrivivax sp.]|nr:glycosyl hydrolase [Rubrivivax sp.]
MSLLHPLLSRSPWATALLAVALAGCASGDAPPAPRADGPGATLWLTTGDKTQLLARSEAGRFGSGAAAGLVIDIDDTQRFQRMVGFGASITDATAILMQRHMSAAQREALLQELFGRGEGGVGFELTRLTLGASDFSPTHFSYNDMPPGQTDPGLTRFSIEPMRSDVLPTLKRALAINPQLTVMASPWSAPGWMKSNDKLIQGSLKPEHYGAFARYLVKYVDAMAAEGVTIAALTIQNEPHFEPPGYPGMRVDPAARAAVVGQHLGPLLEQRGLRTQIIEWDHNWDEPAAPLAMLADATARRYVSGVGWHCYAGEVSVQSRVHDAHPDKDTWFTECSGGNWKPNWPETLPWMARNIVIGSTRHWARGVQMWNLALDENHGPKLGGCPDCRGVVTIDSRTGAVTRNLEYYALAHASKFVRRDAQRVASTAVGEGVDNVAFRNADDGSLVLVLSNSSAAARALSVRHAGRVLALTLPRESVATLVWQP